MTDFSLDSLADVPTHPGLFLAEEIEAREISVNELAELADLPLNTLIEIVEQRRVIEPPVAHALEAALDLPAQEWLNATKLYKLTVEQIERDTALSRAD